MHRADLDVVRPATSNQWYVCRRSSSYNPGDGANFVEQLPLESLVPIARQMRLGKAHESDRDSGLSHTRIEGHEIAKAAHKQQCLYYQDNRHGDLRNHHQPLQDRKSVVWERV